MKNEEEIDKIKKANEDLNQIKGIISRGYSDVSDSMEDDLHRMGKLLDSGCLDQKKTDFFLEQVMSTKKRILECESLKMDEIRRVDGIISDNEESIKCLEDDNEKENSSEKEK